MKRGMTLVHPGEILKLEIIEGRGLTISKAAEILNVTRVNLSNILNGKAAITPTMALKIENAFGGSARLWLQLQTTYNLDIAKKNFRPLVKKQAESV
ncbi:MAG: HigA family addiction module antidote protein [Chitinophagales bacterium]|nr:HigA family addiction module antidote protein [Chitinophagales bacterium]